MTTSLFIPDKCFDKTMIYQELKNYKVRTIHVATTHAKTIAEDFATQHKNIYVIYHGSGRKVMRLYEAIKAAENAIFFYNGNEPTESDPQDGYRTSRALANARNRKKNIIIFPYKNKAIEIHQEQDHVTLNFQLRLKNIDKIKKIYLSQEELSDLITRLQSFQTIEKKKANL